MKKIKFIYNPRSGDSSIAHQLDKIISIHQNSGIYVEMFRVEQGCNLREFLEPNGEVYEYILIAGGDGTIDSVVNEMKNCRVNIPIAVIPQGTANDFAKYLNMPSDIEKACNKIIDSKPHKIDLGSINGKYFINVASAGLFTDVSHKTDTNLKNVFGKMAYYVKGIEQLPNFRSIHMKATAEEYVFDEGMYLILVFNGRSAGNFNLAYKSNIDDGYLDVVIIKSVMFFDILNIFFKILFEEHLENVPGIIHFKTKEIRIECDENIETDIDGEHGPSFPVTIKCLHNSIEVMGYE